MTSPTTSYHASRNFWGRRGSDPIISILLSLLVAFSAPTWCRCAGARPPATPRTGTPVTEQESVRLDLSKKESFVLLTLNVDPQDVLIRNVRITELPSKHKLVPDSGTARLGKPLDIVLEEPNDVRIRLAVVKRGHQVAVRISPQIVLSKSHVIELTKDRLTRTARNLQRRVKHLNAQLVALSNERKALNVWLITPGNKSLHSVKVAHMRMKLLADAIKTRQREVPFLQQQCQALAQAAEFVRQLHENVRIEFEVTTASENM